MLYFMVRNETIACLLTTAVALQNRYTEVEDKRSFLDAQLWKVYIVIREWKPEC